MVGGQRNFWKDRRNFDAGEKRAEKAILERTEDVGKKTKGKGEKSGSFDQIKRSGCIKKVEDSGNGQKVGIDPELTFARIVKLEELIARGSNDRIKLEKTTNYLAKVLEDLTPDIVGHHNDVCSVPTVTSYAVY